MYHDPPDLLRHLDEVVFGWHRRRSSLNPKIRSSVGLFSGSCHGEQPHRAHSTIPQHVPEVFPRSPFEKQMRLAVGTFLTTPFQDLQGITTPSALHFERHCNGVAAIDPSRHRLNRPMMFTVEELKRFPSVSRFAFIQCSGDSRDGLDEAHNSAIQQLHGLTSTGECRFSTILKEAEIRREAT